MTIFLPLAAWCSGMVLLGWLAIRKLTFPHNIYAMILINGAFLTGVFLIFRYASGFAMKLGVSVPQ